MRQKVLLIVIYLTFICLGLPSGVFGVAWPGIRIDFSMPLAAAGIVTFVLLSCSAFSGIFSIRMLKRVGTGRVTLISCFLIALALLGYSKTQSFVWLILLAVPLGIGQGAIDSGLNNYVAHYYSSRHMSWLHCFWGVGAAFGPLIMTRSLATGGTWRNGYGALAEIQVLMILILLLSLRLWKTKRSEGEDFKIGLEQEDNNSKLRALAPWLAVVMFFLYTGTESSVGLWANSLLIEARDIPKETAGLWIVYYYASLMIGRFLTGFIVNKLGNRNLIRLGLIISLLGIFLISFRFTYSFVTIMGLAFLGFGLSPIYPCMMHETPRRFGGETSSKLIGYQVGAARIGGSAVTAGVGLIFSATSLENLVSVLVILLTAMISISEYLNRKT